MRITLFLLLISILLLNACSFGGKYLMTDASHTSRYDSEYFNNKRRPDFNPGGARFAENKELFAQYMKDNAAKALHESEKKYENTILGMYKKDSDKRKKNEFNPNLYDNFFKDYLIELKTRDKKKLRQNNKTEEFIIDDIDLKTMSNSIYKPLPHNENEQIHLRFDTKENSSIDDRYDSVEENSQLSSRLQKIYGNK